MINSLYDWPQRRLLYDRQTLKHFLKWDFILFYVVTGGHSISNHNILNAGTHRLNTHMLGTRSQLWLLVMRWAAVILAIGTILVVLTPSYAWRRRRRRRFVCTRTNCGVSAWSTWTPCTRSCGGGSTSRTRKKTSSESCKGSCDYHWTETKICNTECCPLNCVYTWSAWSKCAACGISTQYRSPNIIRQSSCNGKCPGNETRSCSPLM